MLNIQAQSGDPPDYAHTQVTIYIEDVNDNAPEFESSTVRISIPENAELGMPLYAANAHDKDSGKSGTVRYRLTNVDDMHTTNTISLTSPHKKMDRPKNGNLFSINAETGHLTLIHSLDYETAQRHALIVTATDMGEPSLSANLTILVEVQDVNDNSPIFEQSEYTISVIESTQINSQVKLNSIRFHVFPYYLFFFLVFSLMCVWCNQWDFNLYPNFSFSYTLDPLENNDKQQQQHQQNPINFNR